MTFSSPAGTPFHRNADGNGGGACDVSSQIRGLIGEGHESWSIGEAVTLSLGRPSTTPAVVPRQCLGLCLLHLEPNRVAVINGGSEPAVGSIPKDSPILMVPIRPATHASTATSDQPLMSTGMVKAIRAVSPHSAGAEPRV